VPKQLDSYRDLLPLEEACWTTPKALSIQCKILAVLEAMKAQAGLSGGWLSSRDPEDGAFKVHRDDLLSRLVFEAGMHGATPSVNADSLKRAVKGFWVPRTGASSHAFDKGTEWIRTEAELPANVQLLVAYGRLRKKEAVRGNRTDDAELLMACGRLWSEGFEKGGKHDDAAARGSPRVCRCVVCATLSAGAIWVPSSRWVLHIQLCALSCAAVPFVKAQPLQG